MLLSRIFIAAPLLFCLIPDSVLSQDVPETTIPTTGAITLPTEEPEPQGFFRKLFYNVKKMFFSNKKQNVLSGQQLADLWNQSLTLLSDDIKGIQSEIDSIAVEFKNVTAGFSDPNKDMIGKILSLGASGVSVFADSLNVVNQITKILNDFYQAFNRIGDNLYYNAERNYINWSALLMYVPNQIVVRLVEIFHQILDILNKLKNIVIATRDQIQIALLQTSVFYAKFSVPFHKVLVFLNNQVTRLVKEIVSVILQVHRSLVQTIMNIKHATSAFLKGTIDRTKQGLKKLVDAVKTVQENIKKGLQSLKPKTPTTVLPGASQNTTLASDAGAANMTTTKP